MKPTIRLGSALLALSCAMWATPTQSKSEQAAMKKEATITMQQAQKTALAKEPGSIKSKELEREKGKLIYSFDVKTKSGIHEVNVDAMNGDVVEDSVESPAAEAKEAKQERAHHHKKSASSSSDQ